MVHLELGLHEHDERRARCAEPHERQHVAGERREREVGGHDSRRPPEEPGHVGGLQVPHVGALERAHAGIGEEALVELGSCPTSTARTRRAPLDSRQSVNPPVEAPTSSAVAPRTSTPKPLERAVELLASTADESPGLEHPDRLVPRDRALADQRRVRRRRAPGHRRRARVPPRGRRPIRALDQGGVERATRGHDVARHPSRARTASSSVGARTDASPSPSPTSDTTSANGAPRRRASAPSVEARSPTTAPTTTRDVTTRAIVADGLPATSGPLPAAVAIAATIAPAPGRSAPGVGEGRVGVGRDEPRARTGRAPRRGRTPRSRSPG